MSALQIFLFGKFQVQCGDQVLTGFEACKMQELFSYLLLFRDRPHSREVLASLLWDDCSITESKRHLRQSLWQLKSTLGRQNGPSNEHILLAKPDRVQINLETNFWLDVAVFERAFTLIQSVPPRELDRGCLQTLQSAVELYRGDLLEGCYEDWCLYERERFQTMYLIMLDKLMSYCEAHQDYEAGLIYGARILRQDRARERAHRRLMRLHYLAGDRAAALRQYKCCVTALDEELGVKPSQSTLTLYEQIRADQIRDAILVVGAVNAPPEVTAASLSKLSGHLKQLQAVLADIQGQLQESLEILEGTLKN